MCEDKTPNDGRLERSSQNQRRHDASGSPGRFHGPWKPQKDFPTSDQRSMNVAREFLEQGLAEGAYLLSVADEYVEVFSGPLGARWGGALLVLTTGGHTLLVDTDRWAADPGAILDWADHFLTNAS